MNESDEKLPSSSRNTGSAIALGAGIGLILGRFVLGNAGLGMAYGGLNRAE